MRRGNKAPRAAGAQGRGHAVLPIVLGRESVRLRVADRFDAPRQLVDAIPVDFHAQADLRLDLVALGNGHLAHVVAQAGHLQIAEFASSCGRPHPRGQSLLRLGLLPMADDHFPRLVQPRADVAELAVAVRRLVEVHEVHVDRVPRQITIELRVQMGQGLFQRLQSRDPHLGGRKRVHPADHADARSAAFASRHAWRMDSAVVTTLRNTTCAAPATKRSAPRRPGGCSPPLA